MDAISVVVTLRARLNVSIHAPVMDAIKASDEGKEELRFNPRARDGRDL